MFFNRKPRNGSHFVVLDNVKAAILITQHLLDLGHKRIAYISGKTNVSTFDERKRGFEDAMKKGKVKLNPELIHYINTSNNEIDQVIAKLFQMVSPPTAIICATDAMALICMNIVMEMGYRVPEDISITGIDDIHLASHQSIQLTTVGQKFEMGQIAAENLIKMINGNNSTNSLRQITLKPELVIRKTTALLK